VLYNSALTKRLCREKIKKVNAELKKYFAEIGRKGGLAGKGKSSEKCRKAALARWARTKRDGEKDAAQADQVASGKP
jgi:hypothetical protein